MRRRISMAESVPVAVRATQAIESWLRGLEQTVDIRNVEGNPAYQRIDVDLLWKTRRGSYRVEIKGDRWHRTGNFFLETLSNQEKGTPGCFLYTQADLLFYYFIEPRLLYILPMPATREWFLTRWHRFPERRTTTPVGDRYYTTVGRLVPIEVLVQNVPNVKKLRLPG
jgi:hypothetical protein